MDIVRSEVETIVTYELRFWKDDGGYCFPCDKDGNLKKEEMNDCAIANYEWCMEHQDYYDIANKVVRNERKYRDPNYGICKCGEKVYMVNDYMGAVQCPKCGQWYNLFGQELLPPEQWEEDY